MKEDVIGRLIVSRMSGTINAEDDAVLDCWIEEAEENKAVYDEYPQMLEQQFKQSMSESMDSEAMMLLELARNNGYKVGVKFHAQGYKPIIISLE